MRISQFEMSEGAQTQIARGRSRVYLASQGLPDGINGNENTPKTGAMEHLTKDDCTKPRQSGTVLPLSVDVTSEFTGITDPPPTTPKEDIVRHLGTFGTRKIVEAERPLVGEFFD